MGWGRCSEETGNIKESDTVKPLVIMGAIIYLWR